MEQANAMYSLVEGRYSRKVLHSITRYFRHHYICHPFLPSALYPLLSPFTPFLHGYAS